MRSILFSIMVLLLLVRVSAQDIQTFVNHQLTAYPKSHLLDLYKSCFQDYMGAEHLVTDSERVKAYLDEELTNESRAEDKLVCTKPYKEEEGERQMVTTSIDELPEWYYEPCGIKGRHVRVSLRTIKEGLITEDALLDAFIRSANTKKHLSAKAWSRQWHKIIGTIDKMDLHLPDYDKEKQFIDSLLSVEKYAISHSPEYREAYNPHYRIVERQIFEKELKPLIGNKRNKYGRNKN